MRGWVKTTEIDEKKIKWNPENVSLSEGCWIMVGSIQFIKSEEKKIKMLLGQADKFSAPLSRISEKKSIIFFSFFIDLIQVRKVFGKQRWM